MKKYHVAGYDEPMTIDEIIDDFFDDVSDWEDTDLTADYLNEAYGEINIAGYTYSTSEALQAIDEDRFYEIVNEDARNRMEEAADEARSMLDYLVLGESDDIRGYEVTCVYDDEAEIEYDEEVLSIEAILAV